MTESVMILSEDPLVTMSEAAANHLFSKSVARGFPVGWFYVFSISTKQARPFIFQVARDTRSEIWMEHMRHDKERGVNYAFFVDEYLKCMSKTFYVDIDQNGDVSITRIGNV